MMPAAAPASSQSQQPQPQAWPPNPNAAVSIRGLFKHFDRKIAVNGLALDIPIGSFYGLVGPNGAGKTTTLNMVTGLLVPDAGTAMILGPTHDVAGGVNCGEAHDNHAPARPDLRPTDRFAIARLLRHAARHEPRGDHASRPGPAQCFRLGRGRQHDGHRLLGRHDQEDLPGLRDDSQPAHSGLG